MATPTITLSPPPGLSPAGWLRWRPRPLSTWTLARCSPAPARRLGSCARPPGSGSAPTRSASRAPLPTPRSTSTPASWSPPTRSTAATRNRVGCCSSRAGTDGRRVARPAPRSTGPTPTSWSGPAWPAARASPTALPTIPGCSSPSPPPASARSTPNESATASAAPAAPATPPRDARMAARRAAIAATTTTTRSWASRSVPTASTTRPQCCGTRSPPSYGGAPATTPSATWPAWPA